MANTTNNYSTILGSENYIVGERPYTNKEFKDVEYTDMTLKSLQELQRKIYTTPTSTYSSLNAAQRKLMDNARGYVTEEELEKRRKKVLKYDFTDSPKASKTRKPIKDTKVGGWFSNLIENVKEGWTEMMEEGKENEVVSQTDEEKMNHSLEKKEPEDDRKETKNDNA